MFSGNKLTKWGGQDPDYRFSLANERTFLAWIRTALALLAAVLVLDQVALHAPEPRGWRIVCLLFALTASVVAGAGYFRWRANEIAMRHGRSLPLNFLQPLLTVVIAAAATISMALVFK
jgi:putative membrane protein